MTRANLQKSQQKYAKFSAKLAYETLRNKLCLFLICPYNIGKKGKERLILKFVTMIDFLIRWFEIIQYKYKKVVTIATLIGSTWLVRYQWPVEIMYDQGI